MVSVEKAREFQKDGFSFVCSMCTHLHVGISGGLDNCGIRDCGGLFAGMSYPHYSGPIEGYIAKFCMFCGNESKAAVRVNGEGIVGVCGEHVELVRKFSAPGVPSAEVKGQKIPILR